MDLVHEQQRALACRAASAGGLERLLQIGDAGEDRRDLLELQPRPVREQPRDGSLADAGRAPQDHGGEPLAGDHPPERPVGAEQVILPHDLVQLLRPHPVRERSRLLRRQARGLEQITHAVSIACGPLAPEVQRADLPAALDLDGPARLRAEQALQIGPRAHALTVH
ncbi:MAG: Uncharacterized protein FD124_1450 [Alphaproteobacteria bacterium]|nr:MAG: Uncharacterized protein FD124_1450 [Alphaproteobacteria bacterium]